MLLYQILAYTIHRNILKCHTKAINVKYQLELPDGSYSVSDIQDYSEYISKNMEKCCWSSNKNLCK